MGNRVKLSLCISLRDFKEILALAGYTLIGLLAITISIFYLKHPPRSDDIVQHEVSKLDKHKILSSFIQRELRDRKKKVAMVAE